MSESFYLNDVQESMSMSTKLKIYEWRICLLRSLDFSVMARKSQKYKMTKRIAKMILSRNKVSPGSFSITEGFLLNQKFLSLNTRWCLYIGRIGCPPAIQHYHPSSGQMEWALNDIFRGEDQGCPPWMAGSSCRATSMSFRGRQIWQRRPKAWPVGKGAALPN